MTSLPVFNPEFSSTRDKIINILAANPGMNTKTIGNHLKKHYAVNVTYQAVHKTIKQLVKEHVLLEKERLYFLNDEWVKQVKFFVDKLGSSNSIEDKDSPTYDRIKNLKPDGDSLTLSFRTLSELDNFLIDFENNWVKDETSKDQVVVWQQWHNRFPIMYPQHKFKSAQEFEKKNISHYILCRGDSVLDNWALKSYQEKNIFVRTGMQCSESCETGIYGDIILELFYSDEIIDKIESIYTGTKALEELDLSKWFSDVLDKEGNFYIHIQKNKVIAEQIKNRILNQYIKEFEEVIDDLKKQKAQGKTLLSFKSEYLYLTKKQINCFLKTQEAHSINKNVELNIINEHLKEMLDPSDSRNHNLNLFDLGTGDGKKLERVITFLENLSSNIVITNHCIDFSSKILDLAFTNVKSFHSYMTTRFIKERILSIEHNTLFRKGINDSNKNIIMCLGNFYGNLESNKLLKILGRILKKEDMFIVGLQVRKGEEGCIPKLIKQYSTERDKEFIFSTLEEIDFRKNCLEYIVEYNKKTNNIEIYVKIKCIPPTLIKKTKEIGLKVDDKLLMVTSWKPTVDELNAQLSEYFTTNIFVDEESSIAVAFCKKK